MTPAQHTRLTAWLGLIAIWLGVIAPIVTQCLPDRNEIVPLAALCSAHGVGVPAPTVDDALQASDTAAHAHGHPASHGKHCDYCGLLAHHLPLAGGVEVALRRDFAFATLVVAPDEPVPPREHDAAHRPRGPPSVSLL